MTIFGPCVRNQQEQGSDLDSVAEFNETVGIRFINLVHEIEEIIGTKVDVVLKNALKKKYFQEIESDLTYV